VVSAAALGFALRVFSSQPVCPQGSRHADLFSHPDFQARLSPLFNVSAIVDAENRPPTMIRDRLSGPNPPHPAGGHSAAPVR